MKSIKLPEGEYRFVKIIWEKEPITSKNLVAECENQLGWKKSTTYTVLKRLCEKGVLKNKDSIVTALIKRSDMQKLESRELVERSFDGSLPQFLVSYISGRKLTKREAERLIQLINAYSDD